MRLEPIMDRRLRQEEVRRSLLSIKKEVSAEEFLEVMKYCDVMIPGAVPFASIFGSSESQ